MSGDREIDPRTCAMPGCWRPPTEQAPAIRGWTRDAVRSFVPVTGYPKHWRCVAHPWSGGLSDPVFVRFVLDRLIENDDTEGLARLAREAVPSLLEDVTALRDESRVRQ